MKRFRRLTFNALLAIIVALTGVQATSHHHAAKPDGWHESGPKGDSAHDEDRHSCTMCRLAHETSLLPSASAGFGAPLPSLVPPHRDSSAHSHTDHLSQHSPRAPPCLASC